MAFGTTDFPQSDATGAPVVAVSELLREVRNALERRFPLTWVSGEISNWRPASSGHVYFVLKDASAQVDCVLFRNRAAYLDWQPREGMQVEARALVTLYEPRGRFQLTVETMRQAGLGPLYERFLKLRARLDREGLFDAAAKREIPRHPRSIGVLTSLSAAALRDVLTTLARRNPSIPVIVYPVPVQGEGAAQKIAAMLATASARAECDVLLLVRGGGSIEDLWQFNEEVVARAIRASLIPVVVGVGHETDVTIADFAADRRAPTPTAAAEMVSPSRAELLARIAELAQRAGREARRRIENAMQRVDALAQRLVDPRERIRVSASLLRQLEARLVSATRRHMDAGGYRLGDAPARVARAMARLLESAGERLARARLGIANLDPTAVLARGYSITRSAQGAVLRDSSAVAEGERVTTVLARGWLESEVSKRGP